MREVGMPGTPRYVVLCLGRSRWVVLNLNIQWVAWCRYAAGVWDLKNCSFYRPRTKETREAYESLLSVISQQFGDQPQDVLHGHLARSFGIPEE